MQAFREFLDKRVDKSVRMYFLFSALVDIPVGVVGLVVYGALTQTYGPVWVRNQYFGVWLLALVLFYSVQSVYIEMKKWRTRVHFVNDCLYVAASVLLFVLLTVFYSIALRIDGIVWTVYIWAVNLTNLYVLFLRRGTENVHTCAYAKANSNEVANIPAAAAAGIDEDDESSSTSTHSNLKTQMSPAAARGGRTAIALLALRVVNQLARLAFLVVMCLLLNEAIIDAVGHQRFKGQGRTVGVALDNGRELSIHYVCQDAAGANASAPVFMFESDDGQSLAYFRGLQNLLTAQQRRSCVWDKPGAGFSDYLYTDMNASLPTSAFYKRMLDSFTLAAFSSNSSRLHLVGWGEQGVLSLYRFASAYPSAVHAFTIVDASYPDVQLTIEATLGNWTSEQKAARTDSRYSQLGDDYHTKNSLSVPFGLVSSAQSVQWSDEVKWSLLTEKTWITRSFLLAARRAESGKTVYGLQLDEAIVVNMIATNKSDEQIVRLVCVDELHVAAESNACQYQLKYNQLVVSYKRDLLNAIGAKRGQLIQCTQDVCSSDYLVSDSGANFTVNALLSFA